MCVSVSRKTLMYLIVVLSLCVSVCLSVCLCLWLSAWVLHSCKTVTTGMPECTAVGSRSLEDWLGAECVHVLREYTHTHELEWYTNTPTDAEKQSAPQLVLPDTAAPGRHEESRIKLSRWWWGVGGDPGLPLPSLLVSSLSSSCQHSPHERSDASQRRATSDDTQHANVGSVCQESCCLTSSNFTKAHVHDTSMKGRGKTAAASGAIIHSTAHFSSCSDDIFMWCSICPKTVTQCYQK